MTSTARFAAVLGVFILSFTGCNRLPLSPEPDVHYAITLLLEADASRQKAIVTRVLKNDEIGNIYYNDAIVRVNGITFDNRFLVDSLESELYNYEQDFNYYTDRLQVSPGDTFNLRVTTTCEETITGQTIVPPEFRIKDFNTTTQYLEIQRLAETEFEMYLISIFYNSNPFASPIYKPVSLNNVTFKREYPLNWKTYPRNYPIRITVTTVDYNYYDYFLNSEQSAGISGGRGVFGSYIQESKSAQ